MNALLDRTACDLCKGFDILVLLASRCLARPLQAFWGVYSATTMARPMPVTALSGNETEPEGEASTTTKKTQGGHHVDPDDFSGKIKALEIFAGDGNLTAAINGHKGMKCWSKDIKRSALEDATLPKEVGLI